MANVVKYNSRIVMKHDIEANWKKAINFIPLAGEIIVYDAEDSSTDLTGTDRVSPIIYERFKIGDGITTVNALKFFDETLTLSSDRIMHGDNKTLLSSIIETYILNIDYNTLLAFDITEIITGATSTTSVLGQAILGQMVLA